MKKVSLLVLVGIFVMGVVAVDMVSPTVVEGAIKIVIIGTGGVTGVYYPTGGAIGRIVNKKRKEYGIRVTIESTGGSVFNVNAIMAGDLEFGIVQSDKQYQAINGLSEWKEAGKQEKLRAICSFHSESITLVAPVDSEIKTLEDLKGKIINIGNLGSGTRGNSIDALTAVGIDYEKDIKAEGLKAAEAPKKLQDGRIDAFFYTVGHPSSAIKEATYGRRKVRFIPVEDPGIDDLIAKNPYYAKTYVPVKLYPHVENTEDVPTFRVKATFVTSADVPEDIVYAVTKEVFDNLEDFKKLHPAYAVLTKENMLEGLSAPIHHGAMKYYKEVGLDKLIK